VRRPISMRSSRVIETGASSEVIALMHWPTFTNEMPSRLAPTRADRRSSASAGAAKPEWCVILNRTAGRLQGRVRRARQQRTLAPTVRQFSDAHLAALAVLVVAVALAVELTYFWSALLWLVKLFTDWVRRHDRGAAATAAPP
jgi:hypothetical protein